MEIVFLLIIVSLVFIALLAGALYWAVKSGQFDDLEGHGHQILMDDDDENIEEDNKTSS
jgi:cbb3-type cytochrome oxidase maturation protein